VGFKIYLLYPGLGYGTWANWFYVWSVEAVGDAVFYGFRGRAVKEQSPW
jgi:hypothetical protein